MRDTRALRDWATTNPSDDEWQRVHLWIVGLDTTPWRAPSAPDATQSDHPNYDVRIARVEGTEVVVEYRHTYNGDHVDLISVGSS